MISFYKLNGTQVEVGSGIEVPEGYTAYEVGNEPQELVEALASMEQEETSSKELADAKAYLDSTDWIAGKYHDVVTVHGAMTKHEFKYKYKDVYKKRDEARKLLGGK